MEIISLPSLYPSLNGHSSLTVVRSDNPTGRALIIIPGGGYSGVCMKTEGYPIAEAFAKEGIDCYILDYSVAPLSYPYPLIEAIAAVDCLRNRGEKHISLLGFSAGGHLALMASEHLNEEEHLAALGIKEPLALSSLILAYPVVSMEQGTTHGGSRGWLLANCPEKAHYYSGEHNVSDSVPPTFIHYAEDDSCVPPFNSKLIVSALKEKGIEVEELVFPLGDHGYALGDEGAFWPDWTEERKANVLKTYGWHLKAADFIKRH